MHKDESFTDQLFWIDNFAISCESCFESVSFMQGEHKIEGFIEAHKGEEHELFIHDIDLGDNNYIAPHQLDDLAEEVRCIQDLFED